MKGTIFITFLPTDDPGVTNSSVRIHLRDCDWDAVTLAKALSRVVAEVTKDPIGAAIVAGHFCRLLSEEFEGVEDGRELNDE